MMIIGKIQVDVQDGDSLLSCLPIEDQKQFEKTSEPENVIPTAPASVCYRSRYKGQFRISRICQLWAI